MRLPLAPLFLAFALLCAPVAARAGAIPITVTPAIAKQLKSISDYLNDIKTLQADFLQFSSNGEQSKGVIELARPKHLRIEYDPPSPVVIIANGSYLSYVDKELKQVQHMALEDTPATLLLRDKFDFTGTDLTMTGYEHVANAIRISMVQTKDPLAGELTMVFTENPMQLRKWTIVDAQGVVTNVTLINTRFDFPIPETRFNADFPSFDLSR